MIFLILFLLIGLLIPTFYCVGNDLAEIKYNKIFRKNNLNKSICFKNRQYLIIGTGDISWLHIENESWHFGGKYRRFYRTNLIVGNGPGGLPLDYCFFIKDLRTGEIFNKDTLPRHIYLNDFIGYIRANYYSFGDHGPVGFFFTIIAFAENYYCWEI